MSKHRRYRSAEKTLGTSPGTLTYVGADIDHATKIKRIEYNATEYHVDEIVKLSACRLPNEATSFVNWLDVDGIHEQKVVSVIGQQYQLHPLLLEDVMNTEQKPKIDLYDDTVVFVTLKMLHHSRQRQAIEAEHVSLVLGKNYLISFQEERTKDIFETVIERIKASSGKTRRNGADYLLYALMDVIVDHYLLITERIGEKMDELEEQIIREQANQQTLSILYTLKRELAFIRRTIYPLRDMIGVLLREESTLIDRSTLPYLHDLSDHINQIIESLDSYRELISGLMDVYYSIVSNRMNSVMKTLTIVSAIFIPLTFIAGIYGMNFDNMPELRTKTGYFWVLFSMVVIAVGEVIYFKRRGWM
ncbi:MULTISPECIES: magnesium/cobalt transporter CorA [Spirosoma]|uniref:Magnesium transport protein CorA n=1 Tax=Spirosoma liriopis TaxID=2937440 RepID=A0ABT0HET8_9BACT|nr:MULTISPECIES: magnesium/cobalt transporter CorA [Spirosoma]MCK8490372.1 magnesium/cobalt transporter CorA [Spirosoma liriopis]UHG89745.1 magnesium/cobalt transporter CorA [Spirosoma oryzicola]